VHAVFALILFLVQQQSAAPARTVDIVGTDNMKYSVTRIEAKRGETLRLVLTTQSKMPKDVMAHNIVVLARGTNAERFNTAAIAAKATDFIPAARKAEIVAYTGLAGAGEKVEVTFTVPDAAGNYEFICTFPGHFKLGMKGVLVVK
jgi:azurin